MNIVMLTFTYYPSLNGVANVCQDHVGAIRSQGHKVTVISSEDICSSRYTEDVFSVKIKNRKLAKSSLSHEAMTALENADVIIAHCWQIWTIDFLVNNIDEINIQAKKILVSHGTSFKKSYSLKSMIYNFRFLNYENFICKALNKIDAICYLEDKVDKDRFYDRYLHEKFKIKTPFYILPNAVESGHEVINNFKVNKYNPDMLDLVVVGGFSNLKNEMYILESLKSGLTSGVKITFFGKIANRYSKNMEKFYHNNINYFKRKNIIVEFKYGKNRCEIMGELALSDVILSSSRTECQPLSIIEAMAMGVPFISSDVGAVKELKGGVVFKSKKELCEKLNFFKSKTNLDIYSKRAIVQYNKRHTLDALIKKISEVIS